MMVRALGLCALATATLLLAGCGDNQSVLNPKGPDALQLARLTVFLIAFGVFVLLVVVIATLVALRGPGWARTRLASARTVIWGGIVFPAVSLTGLLGYGIWLTGASTALPIAADATRIEVVGEQWWWRVRYRLPNGGQVESANEIRIPTGRQIRFTLKSADVIHSFWVPNLGGKVDMIPGRTTHLRLQADEPGVYRGQCAEYCGGPHALMALEVVAVPAPEFETWLKAQAEPARLPAMEQEQQGQRLFLSAGCGACHTIRGTPAGGSVGPDLTHLGARRSVGLDTVPITQANIVRFIRDGQHVKPGNRMPPFRIFAPDELDALATYLAGLT
jgi:cytochrome c oxidase subunit II